MEFLLAFNVQQTDKTDFYDWLVKRDELVEIKIVEAMMSNSLNYLENIFFKKKKSRKAFYALKTFHSYRQHSRQK